MKISEWQIEQIIQKHSILSADGFMSWSRRDMILAIKEIKELLDKDNKIKKHERVFPIYEFRPIENGKYLRYANGKWIEDDGEYDIAFIRTDAPFAYSIRLSYRENILWSWCKNDKWSAVVPKHPRGNAWHYMLKPKTKTWGMDWGKYNHVNERAGNAAMDKCCSLYGCANGNGPEFRIRDPYISRGLVRVQETKEIIKFPEIFECMYCGDIDWRKSEEVGI